MPIEMYMKKGFILPGSYCVLFFSVIFAAACTTSAIVDEEIKFSKANDSEVAQEKSEAEEKVDDAVDAVTNLQDDKKKAQDHYRLAERYFSHNDLKQAEIECLNALRYDSNHAGAKALLWEVRSILGKGVESLDSMQVFQALQEVRAKREQMILEAQKTFKDGIKFYNAGDYEKAEGLFKTVIEYARLIYPKSPKMEQIIDQSNEMLSKTTVAKKQKELDEAKLRERLIKDEERKRAEAKGLELRKRIELLFNQAKLHFEREEYDDCILVCNKILFLNPHISEVKELKSISQRLKYMKADDVNTLAYVREFKATLLSIEADSVLPERKLQFPDRLTWQKIENRYQRRLEGDEAVLSEEDKAVYEQLETFHITVPEFKTFEEFVDRLKDSVETIQFVIDKSIDDPNFELVAPPIQKPLSIARIVDLVLQSTTEPRIKYSVSKGAVIFMTENEYTKRTSVLRFYEVNDLLFAPPDFPASPLEIGDVAGLPADIDTEPIAQPWDIEEIRNLIIRSFGGEELWEDEEVPPTINTLENSGMIVIKAPPDTQKGISELLSKLREHSGINVAVESRFIMVDDVFLEEIGMDFRDLRSQQLLNELRRYTNTNPFVASGLDDVFLTEPSLMKNPDSVQPGIVSSSGSSSKRHAGAVVRNMMLSDDLRKRFTDQYMDTAGGAMLQYVLIDAVTLEALVKLIHKSRRGFELTSKSITLLNTTLGNMQLTNVTSYIKDWNAAGGGVTVLPDPVPGVVRDGLSLEVRPVVSADRKYVTLQVKPQIATLVPKLPTILKFPFQMIAGAVFLLELEQPILLTQQLATTVIIPDGGVLMIGGLTTYNDVKEETSIPILNAIPIINLLGSAKFKAKSRQQLLILLKVDIIVPSQEERKQVG